MAVAIPAAVPIPITMSPPMSVMDRGAYRLVAHRRTGDDDTGWTERRRDIDRRRTKRCRLSNDHGRPGKRYGNWESDTYVDPGLGEGHATHENGCN
jgi:hypothetical protein